MTTMPAVVNFAAEPFSVELREIKAPAIGEDDVLLEVGAVSVCGSDLHQWTGQHSWKVDYPVVLGHEFCGTIAQTGARVRGFRDGMRVVSETAAQIDPDSPMTRCALYNLDPSRKGFGYGVDGAMTRLVKVPARCLHRIPDSLDFLHAALTEPCCVAYNAVVHNSSIHPGDRVVVLGPGPIGILCGLVARLRGAMVLMCGLEQDRKRLEVAARCGMEIGIGDPMEWARQSDGLGAEGVIDASGTSSTLKTALAIVRPGGWITKVGWGKEPLQFSMDALVQKNVRLQGSFSHYWPVWERVIRLLSSRQLDVDPLLGGTWPLEQWRAAFETMHRGEILKAVLVPS